ncbi:MAG: hypothetical protein IJ222_10110 [Bacteroidales bacterium]|nr:hypothetical protein [Bacteroidales bacterium]
MNPFSLAYREQQQLFLYTKEYIADTLFQPGGLAGLAGRFIVQFFGNPAVALTLAIICLLGIGWVLRRHFPLILAPLMLLAASLCDPELHFDIVPAIFLASLSFATWVNSGEKVLYGIVLSVLLFPLAGSASTLFALCALAYGIANRKALLSAAVTLAAALATAYIAYLLLATPEFHIGLTPEFFYNPGETMHAGHFVCWFAFPVAILVAEFFGRIPRKLYALITSGVLTLACIPAAITLSGKLTNPVMKHIYRLNHYVVCQDWDALEKASEPYVLNQVAANYYHLAKSCKGTLMKDMFRYPHNGPHDLIFVPGDKTYNYALPYVLYHIGNMAGAQNVAYNAVFTSTGCNPSMLKMLADIDIMRGSYEVADKYLEILSHSLFYRKWALERKRYPGNDSLVESNPELTRGRADFPVSDGFAVYGSPMDELFAILRTNQSDPAAMEYGLAFLLLAKDIRNTARFINEFHGSPALKKLPECAQEALVFFADYQRNVEKNPEFAYLDFDWCRSHGVEEKTITRLKDFQQASIRSKGKAPAGYRNSFWYYLIYLNNNAANAGSAEKNPVY